MALVLHCAFPQAAQSLGSSLRINPWKTKDVARCIYKALVMDTDARHTRHEALFNYVRTYTAAAWYVFLAQIREPVLSHPNLIQRHQG